MKALAFKRRPKEVRVNESQNKSRWQLKFALGALLISIIVPASLLWTTGAQALTNVGPDPNDFRISAGQPGAGNPARVTFEVDNTVYVGATSTSILLYFPSNVGLGVSVASAGLVNPKVYDTGKVTSGNPIVTQYRLTDVSTGLPLLGAPSICDAYTATPTCYFGSVFSLPAGSVKDSKTGYYVVQLIANLNILDPRVKNISNGFYIGASGGAIVGFDSKSTATSFGIQERISDNKYTDWTLKFGADCSVLPPSGQAAQFTWYDPDNGVAGIQPKKTSFGIYDDTNRFAPPILVPILNKAPFQPSGTDFTTPPIATIAGNIVTPGGGPKTTGHVWFQAQPNHTYFVRWLGVWSNNTLQFQLPFDSIFHETKGCVSNTLVPTIVGKATLPFGSTTTVLKGSSVTFSTTVSNTGSSASSPVADGIIYDALRSTSGVVLPIIPSYSGVQPAIPPGTSGLPRSLLVNVSPSASAGDQICFDYVVATASPVFACLTVIDLTIPTVIGRSGDVHAGGGVCGSIPSAGNVITSLGSYGEYVVAASGSVTNFGSNGNNLASKAASLEQYNSVCRPDLFAAWASFNGAKKNIVPPNITANALVIPNTVYYHVGNLTLTSGTIKAQKETLVVQGDLTITGDVILAGAPGPGTTGDQQPSLGIIANNINITGTAHQVDAYLFATGKIDTCSNYGGGYTILCANLLTVNGFLMANTIGFHRFGVQPVNGGTTIGEQITLLPQLYLNPPILFGDLSSTNLTQSQGEKPPLR